MHAPPTNGSPRAALFMLIAAGTLLLVATPASAWGYNAIDAGTCVEEVGCIYVMAGPGGAGTCVDKDGGSAITVSTRDGYLVYHPNADGPGFAHTGVSDDC